ncbi:MAG: hypothetical protein YFSK_2400 [Candidatus Yanofskyibacterium parasiticum]|nr:MAG: hypothetical protein YFSK_2400 [Candidatus Yanofskybacteria bacterium]
MFLRGFILFNLPLLKRFYNSKVLKILRSLLASIYIILYFKCYFYPHLRLKCVGLPQFEPGHPLRATLS